MKRLIITERLSNSQNIPSFEQMEYQLNAIRAVLSGRGEENNIPIFYAIYQMFKFQDKNSDLPKRIIGEIKHDVLLAVRDESDDKSLRKNISKQIDISLEDPLIYDKTHEFMTKYNLYSII